MKVEVSKIIMIKVTVNKNDKKCGHLINNNSIMLFDEMCTKDEEIEGTNKFVNNELDKMPC